MSFDFGNANNQQCEAIQHVEGPLLIIAGPGTGKTFTLVKRIVYLITVKKVHPGEIMVATFTEKAAKELLTRITNELLRAGISININDMYIGTFHSICLRIIKEHLEYTKFTKNYRLIDQFEQRYMIFQYINEFQDLPCYEEFFTTQLGAWKQAGEIARYVNNLMEEMVDVEAMQKDSDKRIVAVANIMKMYLEILKDENCIDFSTIQTEAYALLNSYPNILAGIQSKIKYIMVDEYQDTNHIQELLVFLIAGERENICVVGDDDQGLYRFRGATIRNIIEFPAHFRDGYCKQIYLTTNYRSEKQIIDFYNEWMNTTEGRDYEFQWKNFRFRKKIVAGKSNCCTDTRVVKCSAIGDVEEWYQEVYNFIITLKKKLVIKDFNQIAFLSKSIKSNKIVGLIRFLEDRGVPVYSPRSGMFFQRPEIKEILGCMIMCFPNYLSDLENENFLFPFYELYRYYREECVEAAKIIIERNYATLGKFIKQKQCMHTDNEENTDYAFGGLLYQLLEYEPFHSYIDVAIGKGVANERTARNLSKFTAILGKYEYLNSVDVFSLKRINKIVENFFNMYMRFLIEGGVEEYEDDSEYAPSGCVSFMTIHQSKGMEFPVVMVDSLNGTPRIQKEIVLDEIENKYFHRSAFETREDIKFFDFWRLYYTAFSRAQNLLVLTCHEKIGRGKTPSKYFEHVYSELHEYRNIDYSKMLLDNVKPVNMTDTFSITSHIDIYENCSIQYKFFRELGFTQVRVGSTLFGMLVRETIEDVNQAAMRNGEEGILADNVREWLEENYLTLSKREHAYLGENQIDVAYQNVMNYVEQMKKDIALVSEDGDNTVESWNHIQDTAVEVSLVKPEYILKEKVDLIKGKGDTIEIVEFKSEKKPDMASNDNSIEHYKRQLELYAFLIEQKTGKKVSRMHLYYTGEESGNSIITFGKTHNSIKDTIKEYDEIIEKIHNYEFGNKAINKKLCYNCDMRFYCRAKSIKIS